MKDIFIRFSQILHMYHPLRNWWQRRRNSIQLKEWIERGRPVPPPHVIKQQTLLEYGRQYHLRVLVETGTYQGDMVEGMKRNFERIFSIELGENFYIEATNRFKSEKHIRIIHGDSGKEIRKILECIHQPTLFWLDAHYSGGATARGASDTPVLDEVTSILQYQKSGHVILIDDARCFGTDPAYPTIQSLEELVLGMQHNMKMSIKDDMIRIVPMHS